MTKPDQSETSHAAATAFVALLTELRARGIRIDDSTLTRSMYTSDASLYRVVPKAVIYPETPDELAAAVQTALRARTPITARGAGTSCAGNAIGPGVAIDTRRYLDQVLQIDPDARTATVQPGVVQAALQKHAAPHRLRFGPDPSTSNRCTIGGMIGNNACGPRALGYGRSADNIVRLEVITGTGERLKLQPGHGSESPTITALQTLVRENLGLIRTEFGRFGRQVSGYSLEHLLPENGFDVPRFLAGTEGTLAVTVEATVRLVQDAAHKMMVVLGYPSMPEAADDAPKILQHRPTAAEGLDRRIVDVVAAQQGAASIPNLPKGNAWVFIELVDDDIHRLVRRAGELLSSVSAVDGWTVEDAASADRLWKIRADGAGLAALSLDKPAYGGWEDAAVPPAKLGAYLREFDSLLAEHGVNGLPYGHFGDGCVHCRIDFPLDMPDGPAAYRRFVEAAADLVSTYGGSLSGEHGDGRARSALLPRMYSPEAMALMAKVKAIFDPNNLMNPGVLVDPRPVESDMRIPLARSRPLTLSDPVLVESIHQCSGVGKCLANGSAGGQVMCPSFQATGEEKDSTRGRARVLQEMINGELIQGWDSPEVAEALDLCLSCKGCSRDCPSGVDMASYKSIVTDKAYAGKLRPRTHYALGWLPRWARLVSALRLGGALNAGLRSPVIGRAVRWSAGVDQRRNLPAFARRSNRRSTTVPDVDGQPVAIWVDSFSDGFENDTLDALLRVLVDAGYQPKFIDRKACCGLTWISTGQRDAARKQLEASLDVLYPIIDSGVPVIGVEPSCVAVWRSDATELVSDPRLPAVATGVQTLAELLSRTPGWQPPDLTGVNVVAQPHCHHASVLGWKTDADLLKRSGASVTTIGGCCGLAGNFGVEDGHYDVSVAVAEQNLLPAVRAAESGTVVLADGFSCRLQLKELADAEASTLAQLFASRLQVKERPAYFGSTW
ncbi:FAD-binding oxidoreductase [Rhodococcoides fascians A21d2]|uniref:FAD-binding and (Fe-S)-binding domain-containing protein n=1 Tax=Rhodococcoides fascians TaxID=1828 RepID=UPI00068E3821|nr:FAD-binding and (Fe-S)-binding domain-containing protein [Rhodococcus fascians]QII00267.1 FAD-binding oxidoreductase [Rhodococcus fascians A21d2]